MLDEPFNGMDPEGIVWIRGLLASLAAEGRAVLVSSHLMSELQDTASHLVISAAARSSPTPASRTCSRPRPGTGSAADGRGDPAAAVLARGCGRGRHRPGRVMISGFPAERIVALLTDRHVPFAEVTAHRATLEEAYLELTRDAVEFQRGPAGLAGRAAS